MTLGNVVVLSWWKVEKEEESQKIDDLPVLATCWSGTLAMLSSKVSGRLFFWGGVIPTYGVLPYAMIAWFGVHLGLVA